MRMPLLLYPNPTLSLGSDPVEREWILQEEGDFQHLLENMVETLIWFRGVGLSAIQVGIQDRVFVMRTRKGPVLKIINPEVVSVDGEPELKQEGCLSLPGVIEDVKRYPNIVLKCLNEKAEEVVLDLEGIEAQCAQHELDHLDGKMFSDYYGRVKRDIVKRKIGKQLRLNPLFQEPQ